MGLLGITIIILGYIGIHIIHAGDWREYCDMEIFNATCGTGELILMESARYGRMKLGRCQATDYHIGCSADVLGIVDKECSGKKSCEIALPNAKMSAVQPCRGDLKTYLEASYSCVSAPVLPVHYHSSCAEPIQVSTSHKGYIGPKDSKSRLGTEACPYLIEVNPGQKINITLFDFNLWASPTQDSRQRHKNRNCPIYAVVREDTGVEYLRLCGNRQRTHHAYTSDTNRIEIHFVDNSHHSAKANFLLEYKAVGCPDLAAVANANIKRVGDSLIVNCNYSSEKWHLVCKDIEWIGEIRNCSDPKSHNMEGQIGNGEHFPFGLLIAIAIGVLIGILCGFVFLMAAFVCRKKARPAMHRENALLVDHSIDDPHNMYKMVEVKNMQDGCLLCQRENSKAGSIEGRLSATYGYNRAKPGDYERPAKPDIIQADVADTESCSCDKCDTATTNSGDVIAILSTSREQGNPCDCGAPCETPYSVDDWSPQDVYRAANAQNAANNAITRTYSNPRLVDNSVVDNIINMQYGTLKDPNTRHQVTFQGPSPNTNEQTNNSTFGTPIVSAKNDAKSVPSVSLNAELRYFPNSS